MNGVIELEMRIPVARWLLSRNLTPICEAGSLRNCDMVGFELLTNPWRVVRMVAVELKVSSVSAVIRQCKNHLSLVNETWAAMGPISIRSIERFQVEGIGLLKVTSEGVEIVVPAIERQPVSLHRWLNVAKRRRLEHLTRMKHPQMLAYGTFEQSIDERGE